MKPVLPRRAAAIWLAVVLAVLSGCASQNYLSVRRVPHNPLAGPLQLVSRRGPEPSPRTLMLLRSYDLLNKQKSDPAGVLVDMQREISASPDLEKTYAFAELAYVLGKRAAAKGQDAAALELFSAAVAHTYLYLFSPQFDHLRNHYDPQFRLACDTYNASLEDLLRIINKQGRLKPRETYTIESGGRRFDVQIATRGLWSADAFERFDFVSDFEVKGLNNRHVTYGLGVPLIAVCQPDAAHDPAASFYPRGMSVPVTAILRAKEKPCLTPNNASDVACALELHDPLAADVVEVAGRYVPLETDLTTPLGFFLDTPSFELGKVATWGLLDPGSTSKLRGLYMLEAYDPQKIPVLMVHGLWSSPETWTQMLNDLRAYPEIRGRYQFWTYLYPTGQPFWISAAQMREDLVQVRRAVDPAHREFALDQMVLVGHSMGGLVSRMQTLDSGEDFWRILSDRPFEELQAAPEDRELLVKMVFFQPNPSIRRVITLGTPFRGSEFSNDYTRWLGRKLIKLPSANAQVKGRLVKDNPDFFRNTDVLTVKTSIDSLSPKAAILPVMLNARRAPWVRYHNVVGVFDGNNWIGKISEKGDGVVSYASAHMEDVESEVIVNTDHIHVHQHPRAILEVRRILMEHVQAMYAEMAQRGVPSSADWNSQPASYQNPLRSAEAVTP